MIGNIKWNFIIALCGVLFTFLLSINNNLLTTSLIRCLYAFVFLFLMGFALRFLLAIIVSGRLFSEKTEEGSEQEQKGVHIDLSTPTEQSDAHQQSDLSQAKEESFVPLNPQNLAKVKPNTEETVAAIRHLNDQDT